MVFRSSGLYGSKFDPCDAQLLGEIFLGELPSLPEKPVVAPEKSLALVMA